MAYKNFALRLHPDVTGRTGREGGEEREGEVEWSIIVLYWTSVCRVQEIPPTIPYSLPSHPSLPPTHPYSLPFTKGNNEDKTRIFKQLTEAYNILSDQEARRKYDSKLGISRVSSFYRPGGVGKEGGNQGDIRAPRPPPDFKIFDHDEWNAWHYGEGEGVNKEPFVKR